MLVIEPLPPFRLDLTAWALRRRPRNAIDRWEGHAYHRVLVVRDVPVEVTVQQAGPPEAPRLQVTVVGPPLSRTSISEVARALHLLLGTQTDLRGFYRLARGDGRLRSLVDRFRGLKPPRFPSLFETLVNGVACQQISLTMGIELLNRLARTYGPRVEAKDACGFPRPETLAQLEPEALRRLGCSRQKSRAIIELARAVLSRELDCESLAALSDEPAATHLRGLHGVGRWTAEYVLLRGLGRLHVFPGDDVGARNTLQRWLGRTKPLDYAHVPRALGKWKPYGGLIYFHLLLTGLAEAGHLSP